MTDKIKNSPNGINNILNEIESYPNRTSEEEKSKETVQKSKETVGAKKPPAKKKKPKGKPRGGNSPVIGMNGFNLNKGDNAVIIGIQIELMNMPNIDMTNTEEVAQRLSDYFALYTEHELKPTVAGMAVALNGHSRQWLHSVVHDKPLGGLGNKSTLPPEVTDLIKKAYILLENMWETYMNSGKVNPVAGIFLGKNNYHYQDKTEYVLTPNQKSEDDYDASEIRERYIAAEQHKRLSTTDDFPETTDD